MSKRLGTYWYLVAMFAFVWLLVAATTLSDYNDDLPLTGFGWAVMALGLPVLCLLWFGGLVWTARDKRRRRDQEGGGHGELPLPKEHP
jgi:hypothetical protein